MSEIVKPRIGGDPNALSRKIGAKAERKVHARRDPSPGIWYGLGMVGLIGWSVVLPLLAGVALGMWLDQRHPGHHSWTLSLLVTGLVIGSVNAWHWVAKEGQEMREDGE